MASGYVVSGRGDLDGLFKARTSTAIANTGYQVAGVDLAQRYEPRAGSTAIANTGYKSASADLASLFKDFGATSSLVTLTVTMGDGGGTRPGFANTASGYAAYSGQSLSAAPEWTKSSTLYRLDYIDLVTGFLSLQVSNASSAPADSTSVWDAMTLTGVFSSSGGSSVARTVNRVAAASTSAGGTTPNGRPRRVWNIGTGSPWDIIIGNAYTLAIG